MSKDNTAWDYLLILLAANVSCICFCLLTAWFAYLDNGYWGWPFVMALFSASGFKSAKDKREEEREAAIERAKDIKKYGDIYKNQN